MTSTDLRVLALAAAIGDRRRQIRLTLLVTAELAACDLATLRAIEAGAFAPSAAVLANIARALNTTPEMLRRRADLTHHADDDHGSAA